MSRRDPITNGFTLVEVLVATAIISIALLASLRVAGGSTTSVDTLRARLLAGWVAENILAEQRARSVWLPPGIQRGKVSQGGLDFYWRKDVIVTPNPSFRRVHVNVFQTYDETYALARLVDFMVRPQDTVK